MRSVVEALGELAAGVSYAAASRNVWDKTKQAQEHSGRHEDTWTLEADAITATSKSWLSDRGRNAWHVAGDIVEQ